MRILARLVGDGSADFLNERWTGGFHGDTGQRRSRSIPHGPRDAGGGLSPDLRRQYQASCNNHELPDDRCGTCCVSRLYPSWGALTCLARRRRNDEPAKSSRPSGWALPPEKYYPYPSIAQF